MKTQLIKIQENTSIPVTENSQFVIDITDFTPENKYSVELVFENEGVNAELLGLFKLGNGESLNLTTSSVHKTRNTSCITKVKGVLGDGSRSDYVGKIIIEKTAQQTNAFLEDNILVIGENVINTSSPNLEIEANDVKASHGATTGKVREEDLYYLMSRGLSRQEAEKMIIEGFFETVISTIADKKIANTLSNRLLSSDKLV